MNGETTFLDEFNATAPDLSREVNVMVVGGRAHHYSQNEQVVGTWIDGKPVYEKTWNNLSISMVISGDDWQELSDIDLTGVDKIISIEVSRQGGGGLVLNRNIAEAGVSVNSKLQLSYLSSNYGGTIKYITLQYTKITD